MRRHRRFQLGKWLKSSLGLTQLGWSIDYRIYDPEVDGKPKIDHLREMLTNAHYQKKLPFQAILMDIWYASQEVMRHIERLEKAYFCPINLPDQKESGGRRDRKGRAALPR